MGTLTKQVYYHSYLRHSVCIKYIKAYLLLISHALQRALKYKQQVAYNDTVRAAIALYMLTQRRQSSCKY